MRIQATRRIGIDCGHRVTRHESKCRHVHGHRYEVEVTVEAPKLDEVGRVVDFGVIKEVVGGWLMEHMDHGYLAAPWDEMGAMLRAQVPPFKVYWMPEGMEPTAENLAAHILDKAQELLGRSLHVTRVRVYETPNCWGEAFSLPVTPQWLNGGRKDVQV